MVAPARAMPAAGSLGSRRRRRGGGGEELQAEWVGEVERAFLKQGRTTIRNVVFVCHMFLLAAFSIFGSFSPKKLRRASLRRMLTHAGGGDPFVSHVRGCQF